MSSAPLGTITELPRWTSSTKTPIVIIIVLLIALFDAALLRRTSDVEPVPGDVAPVISDARASIYEYDRAGNLVADRAPYIVFNVAGTYDGLGRVTRSSIPTMSTERSDFGWVADLEKVISVDWDLSVFDLEPPAGLIAARFALSTGVGRDSTPMNDRMVYVYAHGVGDDVQNTDTWIKIGEGTLNPSGSWSVVGTISGDGSLGSTPLVRAANISLVAFVVSPNDASAGEKPDVPNTPTTTLTLADLDAMGRSEIVTVVPRRGLQWGEGTDAGTPSRTTAAKGLSRPR